MKKIIFLALLAFSLNASAQIATPRFGTTAGRDNTGRVLTYGYSEPAYAATITVVPDRFETIYKVATLTGNASIVTTVTNAHVGDRIVFLFTADATGASELMLKKAVHWLLTFQKRHQQRLYSTALHLWNNQERNNNEPKNNRATRSANTQV